MIPATPIIPIRALSSCCDTHKEVVFYASSFPLESYILNSSAGNFTPVVITSTGLQSIRATFSNLGSTTLTKYNTDVQFTPGDGSAVHRQVIYTDDNKVEITWDALGAIEGIFTIKIYQNPNVI